MKRRGAVRFLAIFCCCLTVMAVGCLSGSDRYISSRMGMQIHTERLENLYSLLAYRDGGIPLVSAHRGGPGPGYPENALETFMHRAATQPLVIECDIALSKDSVLVLMHDDKLDRTTTGKGYLKDFTYEELARLQLRDTDGKVTDFKIPKLDDALNWGKGKVLFTLDVKRGVPYDLVIDAVRRNRAEASSIIITYNAGQAEEVYQLAPELMISASIAKIDDLVRLSELGVPDNRLVAFVGIREPDTALYTRLHEHGIRCILGTMGNLDARAVARGDSVYYGLVQRGADMLSTDRPEEAGAQLLRFVTDRHLKSDFIY
ncbi:glycerophosphodiester phosphodiesterase family protein [Olivibacter sitiensis]|uniref:glycerophosphodiester phosphodiesterase family protein n=1 Tax=Olivibacter sitiensis TaxID=376470 RepID=UPI0006891584|nr:glycerophosphodiester phosphodiesterase family protein [Olivibacter sitiensis]